MIRLFGRSSPRDKGDDADDAELNRAAIRNVGGDDVSSCSFTPPPPPTHSFTLSTLRHVTSLWVPLLLLLLLLAFVRVTFNRHSAHPVCVSLALTSFPFHSILFPPLRYDTTRHERVCGLCNALHSTAFTRTRTTERRCRAPEVNPTGFTAQCSCIRCISHFASNRRQKQLQTTAAATQKENKKQKKERRRAEQSRTAAEKE